MHRMCKIIHTDFKPENVVICLREDEVNEIAKTGQLTTTKMFEHQDIIRKINMKVAGTLTTTTNVAEPEPQAKEPTATETNSQIPDGLTAKQRKNLKKKLQRKKKKNQGGNAENGESGDEESKKGDDDK